MTLGTAIREHRKKCGLTQSEFGALLGVPWQTVSQWETGRRHPRRVSLFAIADALNVSVDDLTAPETSSSGIQLNVEHLNTAQVKELEAAAAGMTSDGITEAIRRFCEIARLPEYRTA